MFGSLTNTLNVYTVYFIEDDYVLVITLTHTFVITLSDAQCHLWSIVDNVAKSNLFIVMDFNFFFRVQQRRRQNDR